ncbi:MAG TPA: tetratricopeptide repeat protein [Vicinamibacteria bacterium]|nr:tetratricopeptide repeat protein [Vicinamibacteria bacterium]
MALWVLSYGFVLWMAVEAVRRGDTSRWLWIILVFGPMGAAVYFFSEYLSGGSVLGRVKFRPRKVTKADVSRAEAEVRRLDNGPSWTEYASLLRARQDFAKAAEAAARAVERTPGSLDARYELGLAHLGAKRYPEAAQALKAVVERDRSFDTDDALYALAKAQMGAADLGGARASLEELSTRRARPEILFDLATVQGLTGDRESARRALQRILDEAELVPPYLQKNVKPWIKKARKGLAMLGKTR